MQSFLLPFSIIIMAAIILHCESFLLQQPQRTKGVNSVFMTNTQPPREGINDHDDIIIFGNGNVANAVLSCLKNHSNDMKLSLSNTRSNTRTSRNTTIYCTYRESPPPPACQISGVKYIHFHNETETLEALAHCSRILITIPPIMKDDNVNYTDPVLDNPNISIVDSIPQHAWIGYVSTTGVYGNHEGNWVDESSNTLCQPGSKAFAYLDIERRWQEMNDVDTNTNTNTDRNVSVSIFRCAGLYGENFSALHTVRKGRGGDFFSKTISGGMKNKSLTSRIHLMDVGRSIVACMEQYQYHSSHVNGIFNLADSFPEARNEVMRYAHGLLSDANITALREENLDDKSQSQILSAPVFGSERRRRRGKDRKKVSNRKLLCSLLNDSSGLLYPSYREGLQQILSINLGEWKIKYEK